MPLDEYALTIGEIVSPFGRVGEVKVRLETDFPERFEKLPQVCIRARSGAAALYDVEQSRLHKGQILLKLRGVQSIDDAEVLRNALVQVRTDQAVPLPDDEHYVHEMRGCEVVTVEGESLGQLADVMHTGANDVYVVRGGKREVLLPAIHDVVRSIDLTARKIVVSPTPGLLDE